MTVLSRVEDGRASDDLIKAVEAVLLSDERRPLTDKVTVRSAEIVPYVVHARLFTFPGPNSTVVLTQAHTRLARFVAMTHRLGREVTLSGLYAALHVDGVERVVLDGPTANIKVDRTQAPYCTETKIEHGGVYE